MTQMKEQAMNLIQQIPEEKMFWVVNILKNIEKESEDHRRESAMRALQEILKYKGRLDKDFDAKKELEEGLTEKYGNIN